ncbi:MAG: response regulator transcription factor [Phycisphaerales bacterium]|nr:response regulator transcription factor [Phycisphaerales bacterium]
MKQAIRLLCVDDNELIAQALSRRVAREPGMAWSGWLAHGTELDESLRRDPVDVVLLDVDLPGEDAFELLRRTAEAFPEVRVLMFSGHVRADYIDRAIECGAWGYVSKNDGTDDVMKAVAQAHAGELALSPDARLTHNERR